MMKNKKNTFIIVEAALVVMVIILAFIMYREQMGTDQFKISVIIPNSDTSQWDAFRYGLRMAAEDQGIELFVVSTGDILTAEEQINMIQEEIANGADAIIVQPVCSAELEEKLKKLESKVPVMLVENAASEEKELSMLPITEPDNYAMGKALAEQLLIDYSGTIEGKTLGVFMGTADSEALLNRRKGFEDALQGMNIQICWSVSSYGISGENLLENQTKVDIVIALDNNALVKAGEVSAANNLHGALVYGIGNSTEAVYYLDIGIAKCLVVPDEFNVGYQSLTEAAESLKHFSYKMENKVLSYTIIHREELFSEENQKILFTMSR